MIKIIKCTLLGHKITFTTFTAPTGLCILKKLSKILLPVFDSFYLYEENPTVFYLTALSCLSLENDNEIDLIKTILECVDVDGEKKDFETFFSGNFKLLFSILVRVLKENYAGVFQKKRFTPDNSAHTEHPVTRKVAAESELSLSLWNPILAKVASLFEVSTYWSTEDLYDYLEASSIEHAYEIHQHK